MLSPLLLGGDALGGAPASPSLLWWFFHLLSLVGCAALCGALLPAFFLVSSCFPTPFYSSPLSCGAAWPPPFSGGAAFLRSLGVELPLSLHNLI